ncbi:DNA mismatch repair protein MutH [Pontibacillus halophilus JSM 076056 = DSM 19796]|uniref:DNA mismatch repair protein MutH n=1 Tax=Pontibacillus halophilus JSM 076056 = DSM 19796 TaxID=1385510 RepID=A0A0A5GHL7_9BACI|nr:Sau3AI family type II restriction endonuclease [Pontibacillus halophilus]KGX92761.1 DNA mismatch repair protein MutH [Pontibacillus halophilus JSM 076056 = DSM 19796]
MSYFYSDLWTEQQIFHLAEELEGEKLGNLDKSGWMKRKKDKGNIGNMIQSDFFGIPANSIKGSDFIHHNIELKVTPVLKNKKAGYSSKERLVLGMINYMEDYKISFEESIVNKKASNMLLIFYLHEENTPVEEFKIIKTARFRLSESDKSKVRIDYHSIVDKIEQGKAHEISEKQQKIMGACTKGQGKGKDLVKQPFSIQKAKSRAYSYKVGYMSSYFRKLVTPEQVEHINIPPHSSFLDTVTETLNEYTGKTDEQIQFEMKKEVNGKSSLFNLIGLMFGTKGGNLNHTDEFLKEGYAIKTVRNRLDKKNNQDMSFPNIDFTEIAYDEFEESTWYSCFAETTYILTVWDEYEYGKNRFLGYTIWVPDEDFIHKASELFYQIKDMINSDSITVEIDESKGKHGRWSDNLPGGIRDYPPFQIRPKGSGKSVFVTLPSGITIKKKCLFINKGYIRKIVGLD